MNEKCGFTYQTEMFYFVQKLIDIFKIQFEIYWSTSIVYMYLGQFLLAISIHMKMWSGQRETIPVNKQTHDIFSQGSKVQKTQ